MRMKNNCLRNLMNYINMVLLLELPKKRIMTGFNLFVDVRNYEKYHTPLKTLFASLLPNKSPQFEDGKFVFYEYHGLDLFKALYIFNKFVLHAND